MNSVAQNWTQAMAANLSLSHNPEYQWRLPQPWMRLGENVAQGYTASSVVAAWMASPGHKANILGDFTHVGLGYWVDDSGRTWFTQNFGKYEVVPQPSMIGEPANTADRTGFTSSWTPKPDETVTHYKVELYSADGAALLDSKTTTSPTAAFTGLTENTGYVVKVTAVAVDVPGLAYSSPAKTFVITTLDDLPAVTAPTGLALTASDTSLAASWSALATAHGTLQPYRVELRKGATLIQSVQSTEPRYAFNGLASNTEYSVSVTASTTLKTNTATATATKTTWTALSSVAQVSDPTAVAVAAGTDSTITATWGVPATMTGTGLKYKLTLSTAGAPDTVVETASTSHTFTGLAANTIFTVRIQASITAENGVTTSTSAGVMTNVKTPLKAAPYPVSPAAVVFTDKDGTAADKYTVPATTGVDYLIGDMVVPAGTYPGTGTVTVTAKAKTDYILAAGATATWTATFKTDPAPTVPASPKRLNDFTGDGKTDVIARDASGQLWLYPGTGTGDWFKRIDLGGGWNVMSAIVSAGDFNGDTKADAIARDTSGELWLYPGTGTGDWSKRQNMGGGWNVMTSIVAPGDFNGDGRPDLIARDSSGELWLYPNNGAGDWLKRVDLGGGWNIMSSIVAPGDFNADGNVDLIARDTSGQLWLYPGNGKNEWFKRVDLGAGWNTMNAITAPGDMNGDGRPDVIARDTTGELWLYPNNGQGDWSKRIDLGPGWNPMTAIL